jgi:hypothetical protein
VVLAIPTYPLPHLTPVLLSFKFSRYRKSLIFEPCSIALFLPSQFARGFFQLQKKQYCSCGLLRIISRPSQALLASASPLLPVLLLATPSRASLLSSINSSYIHYSRIFNYPFYIFSSCTRTCKAFFTICYACTNRRACPSFKTGSPFL